jgi:hypothetical protein
MSKRNARRASATARVSVPEDFDNRSALATSIISFGTQTGVQSFRWPQKADDRTVELTYGSDRQLELALEANQRCPGDWGFFVTRAENSALRGDAPEEKPRRRGCRGGGRAARHPPVERSSPPLVVLDTVSVGPQLVAPQAQRAVHSMASLEFLSQEFPQKHGRGDFRSLDGLPHGDHVTRPATAPPLMMELPLPEIPELPCRHTFIHWPENKPALLRQRSNSAPAPEPSCERLGELHLARHTALVGILSRSPTPFSGADQKEAAGDTRTRKMPTTLKVQQRVTAPDGYTVLIAPSDYPATPPRKVHESGSKPKLDPAVTIETPQRTVPHKSTHRGSRGRGWKGPSKNLCPAALSTTA